MCTWVATVLYGKAWHPDLFLSDANHWSETVLPGEFKGPVQFRDPIQLIKKKMQKFDFFFK